MREEDRLYDINFYSRDRRNLETGNKIIFHSATTPQAISLDTPMPKDSKNRKITPLDYDPSGLRTPKTATWENVKKSLEQHARPDHLPRPAHTKTYEQLCEERKKKGLPPPLFMGQVFKWKKVSDNRNQLKW